MNDVRDAEELHDIRSSNPLCAPTKEELIQFLTAWEGVGQLQTFTSREKFRKEARYFIQRLGLPEPPSAGRALDREDLIIPATRYYMGRRTIGVTAHCHALARAWPDLSRNVQDIIRRDLEEEFRRDDAMRADEKCSRSYYPLGDDCDREAWEMVRAAWGAVTKDVTPLGAETRAATSRDARSTDDAGRPQPSGEPSAALHEWKEEEWSFPVRFLEAVKKAAPPDMFAPSLEGIECALLGYERATGIRLDDSARVENMPTVTKEPVPSNGCGCEGACAKRMGYEVQGECAADEHERSVETKGGQS